MATPTSLRRRLSYANVIATLALFFALTGASLAGVKYIVAGDPIPATSDLAGSTYGNPVIAAGKITTAKFDVAAIAPNSDKLDGKDSGDFLAATGVPGKFVQRYHLPTDPLQPGEVGVTSVTCNTGQHVVGGGIYLASDPTTLEPTSSRDDRLLDSAPHAGENAWFGGMLNGSSSSPRYLVATAICATP